MSKINPNDFKKSLKTKYGSYTIFGLDKLAKFNLRDAGNLPYSIKILLENALRNLDNYQVTFDDIKNILSWSPKSTEKKDISFKPGRVILQDFTGVPCIVDLAAMRSAVKRLGGDVNKINPQVPCDLIIDHSLQVDYFGSKDALRKNMSLEFKRNKERYEFLKWGQKSFKNFRVIPPGAGIIHQINLEYLAQGVLKNKSCKETIVYPDTLVGTDSHTTMINSLGIVGWGVGGIEAEAVMLGEPIGMLLPDVIGFKLTGELSAGVTSTDLVLTIVQMLRKKGVVDKFVEFFGEGIKHLSLPDRATISNMAPEYGATLGIFPVDEITIDYYRLTGRSKEQIELIEKYYREQRMFYDNRLTQPHYSDNLELDLSSVESCIAGPKRPQDRVPVRESKLRFNDLSVKPLSEGGYGINKNVFNKKDRGLSHGSVVIASITSCTNTSNPSLLIGAALLAKKAVKKGLMVKPFVKTSFAPGSKAAENFLRGSGLLKSLEKLKFNIVGFGCATCIGNSGPLSKAVSERIKKDNLLVASVLSGNRNFEGRISPLTKLNYLSSPLLVIAYALSGSINIDFYSEPIGKDKRGKEVFLKDIWPSAVEINSFVDKYVKKQAFTKAYADLASVTPLWKKIKAEGESVYAWDEKSTYINEPPYFENIKKAPEPISDIKNARVLLKLGDSVTTDHISPAGDIAEDSPAGDYLKAHKISKQDFNSYGSRRGNDLIMRRGTFANIRLKNQLAQGKEGGFTLFFPANEIMTVFAASEAYARTQTPLIIIAGKEYGTGSSRDWAAKGTALLGVKAVLAESYERIHRSNLIGMGILPLEFKGGNSADVLGLHGDEIYDLTGINDNISPGSDIIVHARSAKGDIKSFKMTSRLDTQIEVDYFKNSGILQYILRKLI
ncbi:MAG: aconitate hydratase AcnA [Candidatus Omnitrophica bacterium]|nr:aconitate hydratase AcnA [Candidatus Omnitrophota bacterium]